jgi:hypothetical protein
MEQLNTFRKCTEFLRALRRRVSIENGQKMILEDSDKASSNQYHFDFRCASYGTEWLLRLWHPTFQALCMFSFRRNEVSLRKIHKKHFSPENC